MNSGQPQLQAHSRLAIRIIDLVLRERGLVGALAAATLIAITCLSVDLWWSLLGIAACLSYAAVMRAAEQLVRPAYAAPTAKLLPERKAPLQARWPELYADLSRFLRRHSVTAHLLLVTGLCLGLWVFFWRIYQEAAPGSTAAENLWLLYFLVLHRLAEHRPARTRHMALGLALVELSLVSGDWLAYAAHAAAPIPDISAFLSHAVPRVLWVALLSMAYYLLAHTLTIWWDALTRLDAFIEAAGQAAATLGASELIQRLVEDLQRTFSYERVLIVEPGHEEAELMCVNASDPELVGLPITDNPAYRESHPGRTGVWDLVSRTQRYYCTNDTDDPDEPYLEANELAGVRSQIVQPIAVNGQVIAFLVFQSDHRRAFALRDRYVLSLAATLIAQLKAAEESDRYHVALDMLVRQELERGDGPAAAKIADAATGPYQAVKALVYVHLGGTKFEGPFAAAAQDRWRPAPRTATVGPDSPLGRAANLGEPALYTRALDGPDGMDPEGAWPYLESSGPAVASQPMPVPRARVILRLQAAGECSGLIYFYFRPPRSFLDTDRARFGEFARLAANALANPSRGGSGSPLARTLTAREREVALLVAEGLTNPEIAAELTRRGKGPIRATTVSGHVSSILEKLGERRRGAIGRHISG